MITKCRRPGHLRKVGYIPKKKDLKLGDQTEIMEKGDIKI